MYFVSCISPFNEAYAGFFLFIAHFSSVVGSFFDRMNRTEDLRLRKGLVLP